MPRLIPLTFCLLSIPSLIESAADINKVNIVWIWFDDLGFGDVEFNGGDYPTPILNELASSNAIKINMQYTEPICSASRSALFSGRYAFRSGLNSVAKLFSEDGFDTDLVLFPSILRKKDWKTGIYGKWHIGYSHNKKLPWANGFDHGIYTRGSTQYYSRGFTRKYARLDALFGEPSSEIQELRELMIGKAEIPVHDTYLINKGLDTGNGKEAAIYMQDDDETYNEELYTLGVLDLIETERDDDEPLFVYYSMFTPHSDIVQPPSYNHKDEEVDYSVCYDSYGIDENGCNVDDNGRCVFCKQVHYASLNIQDIIDTLKNSQHPIGWEDTLVIVTADNGATPSAMQGNAFGNPMPFRGVKAGVHEGGIRTAALMLGGVVENVIGDGNLCEYDEMVHISDWYHIFMSIIGMSNGDGQYVADEDHADLAIWDHIKCTCQAVDDAALAQCDVDYAKRTEMISMRMCGDPSSDVADEKWFYSTTIIKDGMKMVVNGSNNVVDQCDNVTEYDGHSLQSLYSSEEDVVFEIPHSQYYINYVQQHRDDAADEMGGFLYQSDCLDAMFEAYESDSVDADINQLNNALFEYREKSVFNVATDKLEACQIDDDTQSDALWDELWERSQDYTVSTEPTALSFGAFFRMMNSFDCNTTYTVVWNGNNPDATENRIDNLWDDFFKKLAYDCPVSFLDADQDELKLIYETFWENVADAESPIINFGRIYRILKGMVPNSEWMQVIIVMSIMLALCLMMVSMDCTKQRNKKMYTKTNGEQDTDEDDDDDDSDYYESNQLDL